MLKQISPGFYQLLSLAEQKNLVHGFSGRALGDMKIEENREKFLELLKLGYKNLVLMEQIHGHKVKVVRSGDKGKVLEGVDGLVTSEKGLVLGIKVADCLPVLLFDPRQKIIGLAHAGWKGVTSGIVPNVLSEMAKMGVDPKDVLVGIGPHIGGCCFTAFADRVKIFRRKFGDLSGMIYEELDESHLDLVVPVVFQLKNDGVRPENIDAALTCTSCQNEKFFSFRKEKTPQRMLGIIGLPRSAGFNQLKWRIKK